jgi:hypothetical protein
MIADNRCNRPKRRSRRRSKRLIRSPATELGSRCQRISFVGHATLLIQTAGFNLLIDSVWSERVSPLSFAGPKRVNFYGSVRML